MPIKHKFQALALLRSMVLINQCVAGADPGVEIGGGHMASAERELIMGVWGLCPQRGPGAEPLVRGSGGRSPPEAERFLVLLYV